MELLRSILYGLISGLTEFLPISSQAHQNIAVSLFGTDTAAPLRQALIRIACLLSLFVCCRREIDIIRRDRRIARSGRRRAASTDGRSSATVRLLSMAVIPMTLGLLLHSRASGWISSVPALSIVLAINGVILFIPRLTKSGNKDSRTLAPMDGLLMGLAGAASVVPGISRMGAVLCVSSLRGTSKNYALNFTLLLSIPALLMLLIFDIAAVFGGVEAINAGILLRYALTMAAAYIGTGSAVAVMRSLSLKKGFSGFAYYCWCMSLFMMILYLTT